MIEFKSYNLLDYRSIRYLSFVNLKTKSGYRKTIDPEKNFTFKFKPIRHLLIYATVKLIYSYFKNIESQSAFYWMTDFEAIQVPFHAPIKKNSEGFSPCSMLPV